MIDDALIAEGFYNVNEAAEVLRMSPHNIRRLVREGQLVGFRRGNDGGILIPRRAIALLLEPAALSRVKKQAGLA